MRALGWSLVVLVFVVAGLCTYTAFGLSRQLHSPSGQKLQALASHPLATEARSWVASTKGAIDLMGYGAAGAGGLGVLGAIMMAATSRRPDGTPSECAGCGEPIQSGTLCRDCLA